MKRFPIIYSISKAYFRKGSRLDLFIFYLKLAICHKILILNDINQRFLLQDLKMSLKSLNDLDYE